MADNGNKRRSTDESTSNSPPSSPKRQRFHDEQAPHRHPPAQHSDEQDRASRAWTPSTAQSLYHSASSGSDNQGAAEAVTTANAALAAAKTASAYAHRHAAGPSYAPTSSTATSNNGNDDGKAADDWEHLLRMVVRTGGAPPVEPPAAPPAPSAHMPMSSSNAGPSHVPGNATMQPQRPQLPPPRFVPGPPVGSWQSGSVSTASSKPAASADVGRVSGPSSPPAQESPERSVRRVKWKWSTEEEVKLIGLIAADPVMSWWAVHGAVKANGPPRHGGPTHQARMVSFSQEVRPDETHTPTAARKRLQDLRWRYLRVLTQISDANRRVPTMQWPANSQDWLVLQGNIAHGGPTWWPLWHSSIFCKHATPEDVATYVADSLERQAGEESTPAGDPAPAATAAPSGQFDAGPSATVEHEQSPMRESSASGPSSELTPGQTVPLRSPTTAFGSWLRSSATPQGGYSPARPLMLPTGMLTAGAPQQRQPSHPYYDASMTAVAASASAAAAAAHYARMQQQPPVPRSSFDSAMGVSGHGIAGSVGGGSEASSPRKEAGDVSYGSYGPALQRTPPVEPSRQAYFMPYQGQAGRSDAPYPPSAATTAMGRIDALEKKVERLEDGLLDAGRALEQAQRVNVQWETRAGDLSNHVAELKKKVEEMQQQQQQREGKENERHQQA